MDNNTYIIYIISCNICYIMQYTIYIEIDSVFIPQCNVIDKISNILYT